MVPASEPPKMAESQLKSALDLEISWPVSSMSCALCGLRKNCNNRQAAPASSLVTDIGLK